VWKNGRSQLKTPQGSMQSNELKLFVAVLGLLLGSEAREKGECFKKNGWLANCSKSPPMLLFT